MNPAALFTLAASLTPPMEPVEHTAQPHDKRKRCAKVQKQRTRNKAARKARRRNR